MENEINQLKSEVMSLADKDLQHSIFGSKSHNYVLRPVISDQAVAEFEKTHGVTLPEDYRMYLEKIANGGVGPAYGLLSLEESYDNPWIELGPLKDDFILDSENTSNYAGCLLISQRGCGGWTFLVISGQKRGEVWYDDTVVDMGFTKAADNFLSWYKDWVISSLHKLDGQPQDESTQFIQKLTTLSNKHPDRLKDVLDQEPNQDWLFALLVSVGLNRVQANKPAEALIIYKRLLKFSIPEKGPRRTAYLEAMNNAIIAACMAKDYNSATEISDQAQPFVKENPFIAHSAACAYLGAGDQSKALAQCKLAVEYKYPHLNQMFGDPDLAPLANNPEFQKLQNL